MIKTILLTLLFISLSVAQVTLKEVGIHLGYSGFSGMTPTLRGVHSGITADIKVASLKQTGLLRLTLGFDKHSGILSPDDKASTYYPSQWHISGKFMFRQQTPTWGIEEGFGIMYLRDNTDFVEKTGSIGVVFHAGPRYIVYNGKETKDKLYLQGIIEYGLGFGYSKPTFTAYTLGLIYEFPEW